MNGPAPVLEYETPTTRAGWLARQRPISARALCVIATLPTLGALLLLILLSTSQKWEPILGVGLLICFPFILGAWPAILISFRPGTGTRPPPSNTLSTTSATYVVVMLAAFLTLLPGELDQSLSQHYSFYVLLHWGILAWLCVDFARNKKLFIRFLAPLVVFTVLMSVKVQHCPHTTTWVWVGIELRKTGKSCGNPQHFQPWWLPRRV